MLLFLRWCPTAAAVAEELYITLCEKKDITYINLKKTQDQKERDGAAARGAGR
jgi:hypothetical protein